MQPTSVQHMASLIVILAKGRKLPSFRGGRQQGQRLLQTMARIDFDGCLSKRQPKPRTFVRHSSWFGPNGS